MLIAVAGIWMVGAGGWLAVQAWRPGRVVRSMRPQAELTSIKLARQHFDSIQNMKTSGAVTALAALAQETRLGIYRLLVQQGARGMAAGEIAAGLDVTPATLSFHLKELAHAGLLMARHEGRFIYYSADFDAMNELLAFLTENCCGGDLLACLPAGGGVGKCAPEMSKKKIAVDRKSTAR